MFKVIVLILISLIVGCANNRTSSDQVSEWSDWELCHRLADFVYKSQSEWLWSASEEITKRGLESDAKCETVYNARIKYYERDNRKNQDSVSFDSIISHKSK